VPAGASTSIVFSDVVALDQSLRSEVSSRVIVISALPSDTSIIVELTRASLTLLTTWGGSASSRLDAAAVMVDQNVTAKGVIVLHVDEFMHIRHSHVFSLPTKQRRVPPPL